MKKTILILLFILLISSVFFMGCGSKSTKNNNSSTQIEINTSKTFNDTDAKNLVKEKYPEILIESIQYKNKNNEYTIEGLDSKYEYVIKVDVSKEKITSVEKQSIEN